MCTYYKAEFLSSLPLGFSHSDFKSNTARDQHRQHYINGDAQNSTDVVRQASSHMRDTRGTSARSPVLHERSSVLTNGYTSSPPLRPATSQQDRSHLAAGRASFDTHTIDRRPPVRRPHTSMSDCESCRHSLSVECPCMVFFRVDRAPLHPSASKLSFHSHLDSLNERYDYGSKGYKRGSID